MGGSLDTLRNELLTLFFLFEVAITAAGFHRADTAHAAILSVLFTVHRNHAAGCLLGAGKIRAQHDGVRAGGNRFDRVAGVANPAISDDWHIIGRGHIGDLGDRRNLRHSRAGDNTRGADRARPDSDLDPVGEVDNLLGSLAGADVPNNDICVHVLFDLAGTFDDVQVVSVCTVDEQHVRTGIIGGGRAIHLERADSDSTD
jgi:hypothetical protein